MKNVKYNYRKDCFEPFHGEERRYEEARKLYEDDRERIDRGAESMREMRRLTFLFRVVMWFSIVILMVYFFGLWGK